ncbi:hypothetical protein GUJ93_ZPchr0003g18096 [Zizania palustris]|uniref:Uncharacterized protein n=1 Tax=Zizania palustris TaxID=103762 RepID=A0A8J5V7M3_ZIZPA|nr:hypothetical protein GUJ93_ZPchr0003g18096 [Zizania palustris]
MGQMELEGRVPDKWASSGPVSSAREATSIRRSGLGFYNTGDPSGGLLRLSAAACGRGRGRSDGSRQLAEAAAR